MGKILLPSGKGACSFRKGMRPIVRIRWDLLDTWGLAPEELEALGLVVEGPGDHSTGGKEALSWLLPEKAGGRPVGQSAALGSGRGRDQGEVFPAGRDPEGGGWLPPDLGNAGLLVGGLFLPGDANNDGRPELNLLLWKEGSFGPQRPFWVEGEDRSVKNHLFVFKLEEGEIKAVWQSSNLDRPNLRAALIDRDGDGKKELLALEGTYTGSGEFQLTLWQWNGWGFSRLQ